MANNANSTLTTDLSVAPYFDDYNESKNFYRILYKPGYPVQGRELNQMQTILQKQIDRFGKHVFREGSIVLPGQFNIDLNLDYVKVQDNDYSNNSVTIDDFLGQTIYGATNNVIAQVVNTADGTESATDTKTIFIRYTSSSNANTQIATFEPGEVLTCNAGTLIISNNVEALGKGSRFEISSGVFFAKEHFIAFDTQSIILDRYGTSPTCRVGFSILEETVNHTSDSSLRDPALEASNYAAPGADRLKLTPSLALFDIDDDTGAPDFVELFTIQDGVVTELYERSQYNILKDEMAKRTLDESGDYYVRGLDVRVRENLDTGENGGYSTTGNSHLLSIGVEPGVGYVKGYEIGKLVTDYVTTEKAETFENVSTQIATATMGNYLRANELKGFILHDFGTTVHLKDVAQRKVSTAGACTDSPTGNTIGTAKVKTVEYYSGTLGAPSGNVNVYLFDIKMNGTNSFSNTRALYTTNFFADAVLESNVAVLKETSSDTLLYYVGADAIRNLKDISGNPSATFNFKRSDDVTLIAAGSPINMLISTSGETFPYGTVASLSESDKRDITLTIKSSSFNIAASGTVSNVGNTTLAGSGTSFTYLNVGDKVTFFGNTKTYVIDSIANNTYLTVTDRLPSLSAVAWWKAYKAGDQIDLTGKGFTAGVTRTVATTPTTLTFDLKETFPSDVAGKVTFQATRTDGREISKALVSNVFVSINVSNSYANVYGPYGLGFADVYRINKIVSKASSTPTSLTDGTDVTTNFIFDNGQRDNMYEHATITPKSQMSGSDRLLVSLDYFVPSYTAGVGYFSVDSYPVDDTLVSNTTIKTEDIPIFTSPLTKTTYDLRNYIDFRPIKSNTAIAKTTVSGVSVNPANSSVFLYEASGLRMPVPSTQFSYDYSYYFARIDIVTLDKDGKIIIIKGVPRASPITPIGSEDTMTLASLYIAPYPSLAPNYAQMVNRTDMSVSIKKLSNIRFTMRDIGVLKSRIMNLEYYASLSLLEKTALDLKVVDEAGLDRFKSGIFVDTFRDHSLGDSSNEDYRIVVDNEEEVIRPIYTMNSLHYDYLSGTNVTKTGDLITLPYTEETQLDQPKVTTYRNIELSSYRFIGNLDLTPSIDVWVDTEQLEDNAIRLGDFGGSLPQNTAVTWNSWQTKVTGFQVTPGGPVTPTINTGKWKNGTPRALLTSPNSPRDKKITEVSTKTRTGTQTVFTGWTEENVSIGDRVLDVALTPYIRPQSILIRGRGLKPSTRLHVYFDGENLSSYVTPLVVSEYNLGLDAITEDTLTYNEGDTLNSNSGGNVYFLLRLPSTKKFRVGQKEIVVTDSPTNAVDASTYAKNYFVAEGMVQQKQETILSTRKPRSKVVPVTESATSERYLYIDNASCAAYSFFVKTNKGEEGIFLTSVDVYFAAKHPTLGVWVEIRAMDNAGGITRTQVPFSEIWVESTDITLSTNGYTNPHKFTFQAPVFLYNNTEYAFVIHTVGINPDTYFWISRLGETDVRTRTKVNARPLTGTFYTTNNNLNWDMVPDIDLRCTFYRASFTTGVTGEAILGNKPFEKLALANTSAAFSKRGEGIKGPTGKGILENYTIYNGNATMTIASSNGNFSSTEHLVGLRSGVHANVASIQNQRYSVIDFEPAYINFKNTSVQFQMSTTSNTGTVGSYFRVIENNNYYFDEEKAVFSRSNEVSSLAGAQSNKVKVQMSTSTNYLSPVFDLGRTHSVYVDNIINVLDDGDISEANTSGGNLINRYISQPVALAEGQDAEDMLVQLTAYRPPTTDIRVWMKILHSEDSDTLAQATWYELDKLVDRSYSSLADRDDFKEFTFKIPTSMLTGPVTDNSPGGEVQYTNSQNITFTGYRNFQIKIGLEGSNSAVVPRIGDLRVVCLQI